MKAESVTILSEAVRAGIFLSIKLKEDTAATVLLILEDGRMPHTRTLLQITAHQLSTSSGVLICVRSSSCEFLPHMSSGFSPDCHHSFTSMYFFLELFGSQFVPHHWFPPAFLSTYPVTGRYFPSPRIPAGSTHSPKLPNSV